MSDKQARSRLKLGIAAFLIVVAGAAITALALIRYETGTDAAPAQTPAVISGTFSNTLGATQLTPQANASNQARTPWEYDPVTDRHWDPRPGHNHWHNGPPPNQVPPTQTPGPAPPPQSPPNE